MALQRPAYGHDVRPLGVSEWADPKYNIIQGVGLQDGRMGGEGRGGQMRLKRDRGAWGGGGGRGC